MSCSSCGPEGKDAVLTPEIKEVVAQSPFLALTTVSRDGQPHLIVVGKVKEIRDGDTLVFGVYGMKKTRQNLSETGLLQVAAVSGKVGYRFSGKATFTESEVFFTVEKADSLL